MRHTDGGRRLPEDPARHNVVVLGASPKPARYSNRAVRLLREHGYHVIPVHPKVATIEGLAVSPNLRCITDTVHTLTLYVGPQRSVDLVDDIVVCNPCRVIFNPGTESESLEARLRAHHIDVVHGCTLVMLRTKQF